MIDKLNKLNKVLLELLAAIVGCGVFFQAAGVWFVTDKIGYSTGLLIGILIALAMAVHMAWALDMAVDLERGEAEKRIRLHSILRYLFVTVMLAVVMYTGIANPLASFLGVMCLKVAAYLQPITHKFLQKIQKNEEEKPS